MKKQKPIAQPTAGYHLRLVFASLAGMSALANALPMPMNQSLKEWQGTTQDNRPSQANFLWQNQLEAGFVWAGGFGAWEIVNFDSSGATFGTGNPGLQGRNTIRTIENDYATVSFDAYVTVESLGSNFEAYLGLGKGNIKGADALNPSNDHMVYLDLRDGEDVPDDPGTPDINEQVYTQRYSGVKVGPTSSASTDVNGDFGVGSPIRLKMSYNATAKTVVFSFDNNYDGVTFVADHTLAPISTSDLFSGKPSKVFFGARSGVVMTDFVITGPPAFTATEQTVLGNFEDGALDGWWTDPLASSEAATLGATRDASSLLLTVPGSWNYSAKRSLKSVQNAASRARYITMDLTRRNDGNQIPAWWMGLKMVFVGDQIGYNERDAVGGLPGVPWSPETIRLRFEVPQQVRDSVIAASWAEIQFITWSGDAAAFWIDNVVMESDPAPASDFASWALTNGVVGGPTGDSDNDGVANLVEYALVDGGERGNFNAATGTVSFTRRAAPYGADVTLSIEESDDLGITDAWQAVTPVIAGDTLGYTLPTGRAKVFTRLKVIQN